MSLVRVTAVVLALPLALSLGVATPALGQPTPPPDTAPSATRLPPAPTRAEAKRLLASPKGSTSLGGTSGGKLLAGVEIPLKGKGWAFFEHIAERKTNYGTKELAALLERVAARVVDAYPGSVIGCGNFNFQEGGKIPWSVSHQAGRDADLGMFAVDARGKPVNLRNFVAFGPDGTARAHGKTVTFDDARNLALVRALLEDTEAPVQWIFVADWLKGRLVERARLDGASPELLRRLDETLKQPSDSNPHADHFHVRIYCSVEDRLHGCLNWGPVRDWVDAGDAAFLAHVEALVGVMRMDDAALRLAAVDKLTTLRAKEALFPLVGALEDPNAKVRRAALRAVRTLEDPAAIPGLLASLSKATDPAWAGALFETLYHLNTPSTVAIALGLLERPEAYLSESLRKRPLHDLERTAARIFGRLGRKDVIPALLGLLDSPDAKVRLAAHDALRQATNQPIDGPIAGKSAARRRKVVAAWRKFWEAHKDDSWHQWMRLGFEARGLRFDGKMMSSGSVPLLIDAIAHKDTVAARNALRVLGDLTGHLVDFRWRTQRNHVRHWKSWWAENKARFVKP